jgi:hypothetical protein
MIGLGSFLHPWLLAGLGLIALPILIHLFHRIRFRRVRFAAMDFLRESQRRSRRRIWWEQLLLLLMRCAIVALIVLGLARPQASGSLATLLGQGGTVDHWLIWDDSASMGQQESNEAVFDRARTEIQRLVEQLGRSPGRHFVTILSSTQPREPLLERRLVDEDLVESIAAKLIPHTVTWLATSPLEAIEHVMDTSSATGAGVLHLFSDFCVRDWEDRPAWVEVLGQLESRGIKARLINLAPQPPDNLGITDVRLARAPPAAGVPFGIEVAVKNYAATEKPRVAVHLQWNGQPLASRVVDAIGPEETTYLTWEVASPSAGVQEVVARIDADGLTADDARWLAIETPESVPVLIVDESLDRRDSTYLSLALAPGGDAATGIAPVVRSLREAQELELSGYRTIFLLNLPRIDGAWALKLRAFVEQGGGLAIFAGDQLDATQYNETLTRSQTPLLPARLKNRQRIDPPPTDADGDLRPSDHPIFALLAGQRNSFLQTVSVDELYLIEEETLLPGSKRILDHREGFPLWIEMPVGQGKVLLSLTTAGDTWTSWPQNPSYVVTMLSLQDYLSSNMGTQASLRCGEPWTLEWDLNTYQSSLRLRRPGSVSDESRQGTVEGSRARFEWGDSSSPGVYRILRSQADGSTQVSGRAFNIDPAEGDLRQRPPDEWRTSLTGTQHEFLVDDPSASLSTARAFEAKDLLLGGLLLLLVAEQFWAYRLGFHRNEPWAEGVPAR